MDYYQGLAGQAQREADELRAKCDTLEARLQHHTANTAAVTAAAAAEQRAAELQAQTDQLQAQVGGGHWACVWCVLQGVWGASGVLVGAALGCRCAAAVLGSL